jgi:hypothetical protein
MTEEKDELELLEIPMCPLCNSDIQSIITRDTYKFFCVNESCQYYYGSDNYLGRKESWGNEKEEV